MTLNKQPNCILCVFILAEVVDGSECATGTGDHVPTTLHCSPLCTAQQGRAVSTPGFEHHCQLQNVEEVIEIPHRLPWRKEGAVGWRDGGDILAKPRASSYVWGALVDGGCM